MDEIASAAGISRRTFFRYFDAKPDAVWGEFDAELERLAARLAEAPADEPMLEVLRRSVMATNRFGAGELDELRIRRLQSAYVDAVNRRAWSEFTDLFLPDSVLRDVAPVDGGEGRWFAVPLEFEIVYTAG